MESLRGLSLAELAWGPGLYLSFFGCQMGPAILSISQDCHEGKMR